MAQQTAVEWLVDWMEKSEYYFDSHLLEVVKIAKAMEKKQIEIAYINGGLQHIQSISNDSPPSSEDYFEKTYK